MKLSVLLAPEPHIQAEIASFPIEWAPVIFSFLKAAISKRRSSFLHADQTMAVAIHLKFVLKFENVNIKCPPRSILKLSQSYLLPKNVKLLGQIIVSS